MLALDDVVPDDPRLVLAALCDYVKVDLTDAPGDLLGALVRQVRAAAPDAVLLAERVETEADRGRALAAGFTLLQGYLLSRPTVLRRDALRHHAPTAAALLLRLADPHTSASTLGALAASDPAIAAKLLRAVNNVTGARLEVADLGRAIALLGRSRLTALLVLDVVASFGHDDPESPLLAVARTRAAQLLCPDEPLAAATEALARLCARLLGCDRHEARAWLGVPPAAPAVAEACDALDSYLDAADLGAVPQLVDPYTPLDVSIVWLSGLREGRELLARLS
jgi:EAL and modified HD-GYP domain-containing signal transduction protein